MEMAETHIAYQCDECQKVHRYSEEAEQCCGNYEEREVYECSRCDELHLTDDAARACCVEQIEVAIECVKCGEVFRATGAEEAQKALERALDCCIAPDETTAWVCKSDDVIYNTEDGAQSCCPQYTEVTEYECPVCIFRSSDKGIAMMHCQK